MKKLFIAFTALIVVASCNPGPSNQKNAGDSAAAPSKAVTGAKGKPVDCTLAMGCLQAWRDSMTVNRQWSLTTPPQLTLSVGFTTEELKTWMAGLHEEEIRVCLGIYTRAFITAMDPGHPEKIGRIGVFLWPCAAGQDPACPQSGSVKGGNDDPPYDLGDLKP